MNRIEAMLGRAAGGGGRGGFSRGGSAFNVFPSSAFTPTIWESQWWANQAYCPVYDPNNPYCQQYPYAYPYAYPAYYPTWMAPSAAAYAY